MIDKNIIEKTEEVKPYPIKGEYKNLPIYRIPLNQLKYNKMNGRISTYITEYEKEYGKLPEDTEELNQLIEGFIENTNPGELKKTKTGIEAVGQYDAAAVLSNGVVVDGNRRLTALRQLLREGKGAKYGYLKAAIFEQDSYSDKEIKTMELNLQHGKEQPLDYNPIEYLVDIYRDLLAPNHEFNPEEYAAATNKKTSFIRKNMRIAQLLVDYLEFINKPLEFHVARKMSLDGPLREVDTILRSKKVDDSDEYEIKVYLFTNILVLRGDITRIVRNLRPIVEDKRKFEAVIEDSEEDLETIYDLLHQSQEDTSNPLKSEEDFIIPDIPIETQESIQSKTDNLIEEDKLKKAQNKPLELIKMSLARIEEVDSESIIRMSNANKEEFRQYLVSMEEAVTKLSDDLDAN